MSFWEIALLCSAGFGASVLGIIVGGHSFITVPLMIFWGMSPAVAIATNRFSTLFFSIFGLSTYHRNRLVRFRFFLPLSVMAVAGALLGSHLVLAASPELIRRLVAGMMVGLVAITALRPDLGAASQDAAGDRRAPSSARNRHLSGMGIAFLLGIYWGFFGGGGTTLFTLIFVVLFQLPFLEGIANANLVGFSASLMAAIVFVWKGVIDYLVGTALGLSMGLGAWLGAYLAIRVGNVWVRRVFQLVVILFAIKLFRP